MKSRGRDSFNKVAWVLDIFVRSAKLLPVSVRARLLAWSRRLGGIPGIALRFILVKSVALECGSNVSLHSDVLLFSPQNLGVGNNVSIHPLCYIDATGGISIGSDVSIAHGTTIMSTEHRFGEKDSPIKDQGTLRARTVIGDDVWIGAKASILAGCKVGSHSIVAAGAVVTKDVPEAVIVAGVPARVIRER